MYAQYTYPASEEDYDFRLEIDPETVEYYKLSTYRLNLKNGKYKAVNFDYLITDVNASFNEDTIQLSVQEIDDKVVNINTKTIIINSKLKTKEVDYEIGKITKITKKRFLVENGNGLYLIDNNYNKIAYLGDYDNYFCTTESIILIDWTSGNAYVTTLDGVTVKQYDYHQISNIHDDKYYLVKTSTVKDGLNYTEYYLERLGIRESSPVYSQAEVYETYEYQGKHYMTYDDSLLLSGVSINTRVRQNGSTFAYDFFDFDGELLLTLDNFTAHNRTLIHYGYSDEEIHVLYISTATGGVGYTIVVDR